MRSIPYNKRKEVSNLFNINFNINNDVICILDDFITTGSSFRNAFEIIPTEIDSVGVCLFKLI
jgi:orotate phosphoribosyltransferase